VRAALKSGRHRIFRVLHRRDWSTHDLVRLLVSSRNRVPRERDLGSFIGDRHRYRHSPESQYARQAKKNIHVALRSGNDSTALWLDQTMTYSSALFARRRALTTSRAPRSSTGPARQVRAVTRQLSLRPVHVCSKSAAAWGGLAEAARGAASRSGVTLSTEHCLGRQRWLTPVSPASCPT